jgi:hypothetical protein
MVVYVLIALVAVAVLVGGYRVLGGAAAHVVDPDALLRGACDGATQIAAVLSTAITAGGGGESGQLLEVARSARRRIDGCAQQLERLDPAALEDHALAEAHALTAAALEALGWAARMCATPGYAANPSLQRAVDGLRGSADGLLAEAQRVLSPAAS